MDDEFAAPVSPPKRSAVAILRRWAVFLGVASFFALLLGEIVGSVWPFVLLTPMTPQWAASGLVAAILLLAIMRKQPRTRVITLAAVAGGIAALWGGLITFSVIPWRTLPALAPIATADPNQLRIKIAAANVHTENADHDSLLKLIEEESPDIVILPEVDELWARALRPLNSQYAVHTIRPDSLGNFGMAFYSRLHGDAAWSTLGVEKIRPGFETPQIDATLQFTDPAGVVRRIRVIGLHPLPPIKYGNTIARDAVLNEATALAGRHELPTILAGDFNATRYCRIMQAARRDGLADAMAPLRVSWPNTWSWPITGIRIDQILATDDWRVVESHAGRDIGSDHLPMVATLQLVK